MSTQNSVTVQLEPHSPFVDNMIPIQIRDGRLKLLKTIRSGATIDLDDGVYEISAVLVDGRKYSKLVHLQRGTHAKVTLAIQTELLVVPGRPPRQHRSAGSGLGARLNWTIGYSDGAQSRTESVSGAAPDGVPIKFVASMGATLIRQITTATGETRWVFGARPDPNAVPCAHFDILGRNMTISLPVNPAGIYPESACDVVTMNNAGVPEVRAWISPERTVASAMQQMAASGYLLQAAEMAGDATYLLRDKYSDPTGALLGALLLNRIGQLEPRLLWVKNLTRDFSWLKDAKVLLALLLSKEKEHQDEAFALASGVIGHRMMFTESYSLLLNLLRRWPSRAKEDEARDMAGLLAAKAPVNWDSMMFYDSDGEEV